MLNKKPPKELKRFIKVFSEAGEGKTVQVEMLLKYATGCWDEKRDKWTSEKSVGDVLVDESSEALALAGLLKAEKTCWELGLQSLLMGKRWYCS